VARSCLREAALGLSDVDMIVAAPARRGYRAALASHPGVPVERITVADDERMHTGLARAVSRESARWPWWAVAPISRLRREAAAPRPPKMIGDAWTHARCEATVSPAKDIHDVNGVDAVVVAGALYADRWRGARPDWRRGATRVRRRRCGVAGRSDGSVMAHTLPGRP
jgi:hypothetical protein